VSAVDRVDIDFRKPTMMLHKGRVHVTGGPTPPPARWRQWMGRVEAVIFASPKPVGREDLAKVVGEGANLDHIIDDIRFELSDRP
jgi:hypothetical protein